MWRYARFLFLFLLFTRNAIGAAEKNVLILHQGSRSNPYSALVSNEMQKDLAKTGFDVQFFDEYLDGLRLSPNQDLSRELSRSSKAIEAKYADRKIDVVVTIGDVAFELMRTQPPAFLRGTPFVFLTVPDYLLPSTLPTNVTGVTTPYEAAGNIRLAMTLQPGLRHLFYVSIVRAPNDPRNVALSNQLAPLRSRLDFVSLQGLPLDEILNRVKSLPPHSAILLDGYAKDPDGKAYVPEEVCALIAARANAPVYAFYESVMGKGALGGVLIPSQTMGQEGARIVRGLLNGAPVSQYPVEHAHNEIMVDWNKFQQFGLSEKSLPSSAILLFRPPSLWEKYRWYIIGAGAVILLQAILIIELALAGKRRKKSEQSARELAARLISAQEEERRRIAGELHDDISQRLALVAIHLDMLRKAPRLDDDLAREVSVLYDEADLISSDIHQFSHELHPAVLERLGLASALRRYCAEFSAHRGIEVDMGVIGDELPIDRDVALAFFRIGQECLMNVAKHSGALICKVLLTYTRNRIILAVEDDGKGFDPKSADAGGGLGLQSMRERLRSVEGTLRIQSSPLHGTRISAEIRLTSVAMSDPLQKPQEASDTQSTVAAA